MVRRAVAVVRGTLPRLRPVRCSYRIDNESMTVLVRTRDPRFGYRESRAWWWSRSGWLVRGSCNHTNQGGLISAATVTTLATRHYVTAAPHGLYRCRGPAAPALMRLDRY